MKLKVYTVQQAPQLKVPHFQDMPPLGHHGTVSTISHAIFRMTDFSLDVHFTLEETRRVGEVNTVHLSKANAEPFSRSNSLRLG
jgi:hypothetical protein